MQLTTFASITVEEAIEALRHAEEELARLEPIEVGDDDGLAWAGSHE